MKVLITGGAGFIGSNFVHHVLGNHTDWEILNLDKLTYAGNLANLADIGKNVRHQFVEGDIADFKLIDGLFEKGFDVVVHFAAETHVDRSFVDPLPFVETNTKGTQILLEGARKHGINKFIHISTPEVYGGISSLDNEKFSERSPFLPTNPYSASKAAADLLCLAYHYTYGLPVAFTRFANVYGPYQYTEKLIPLAITKAIQDKSIPIYGHGEYRRNWIYVDDVCKAIDLVIQKGVPGEAYNIGSGYEMTNLELIYRILDILQKPRDLIAFVADRPSHDWQYPLDSTKIMTELGWRMDSNLEDSLRKTIKWYQQNKTWWENLDVLDYREYYQSILKSKRRA
jgi:dTDP-glucose 4,6-dehydratase